MGAGWGLKADSIGSTATDADEDDEPCKTVDDDERLKRMADAVRTLLEVSEDCGVSIGGLAGG